MSGLRASSILVSAVVHAGAIAVALVEFTGGRSLEQGTGNDLLRIEQGMAIEGLTRLGDSPETVEAREVVEQEASAARPELEEIKAAEVKPEEPPPPEQVTEEKPPEIRDVVSSPLGPQQEVVQAAPPPDVLKPQPKQVATEQQVEQVAVLEQKAASQSQQGGDATLYRAYLGSLRTQIEKHKVKPKAVGQGTVVVKFTVNREGAVTQREIVTTSGSASLDEAALLAIEKAAPFPKFPEEFSRQEIVLSIPFRFVTR